LTKKEIDSLKLENDNLKKQLKQNEESTISLKNENDNLKKQLKEYEESLNSLLKKFNGFEKLFGKEIDEKKRDIEIKKYLIGESISTIKSYKDYSLITNGINDQLTKFNSKTLKLKLIYKSSRDGQKAKDFHYFCDNKGPTVTIIKTKKMSFLGDFLVEIGLIKEDLLEMIILSCL
jgi:FtsZ-binding cell division protein ZapB